MVGLVGRLHRVVSSKQRVRDLFVLLFVLHGSCVFFKGYVSKRRSASCKWLIAFVGLSTQQLLIYLRFYIARSVLSS